MSKYAAGSSTTVTRSRVVSLSISPHQQDTSPEVRVKRLVAHVRPSGRPATDLGQNMQGNAARPKVPSPISEEPILDNACGMHADSIVPHVDSCRRVFTR